MGRNGYNGMLGASLGIANIHDYTEPSSQPLDSPPLVRVREARQGTNILPAPSLGRSAYPHRRSFTSQTHIRETIDGRPCSRSTQHPSDAQTQIRQGRGSRATKRTCSQLIQQQPEQQVKDAHRMVPGGPAVECSDLGWRDVFLVPLLKPSLGDRVFALDAFEQRRDLCEGVRPGEILAVGLISECAVMLDVLAGGLHGGHAKGGGGAL